MIDDWLKACVTHRLSMNVNQEQKSNEMKTLQYCLLHLCLCSFDINRNPFKMELLSVEFSTL